MNHLAPKALTHPGVGSSVPGQSTVAKTSCLPTRGVTDMVTSLEPTRFHGRRALALIGLLAVSGACSTRAVPDHWPRTSAASPEAREAPAVGDPVALSPEPPLAETPRPGEGGDGGAPPQDAMPPGHQHMHHGG